MYKSYNKQSCFKACNGS